MTKTKALVADESGFVLSAELALIITLSFTAMAVGLASARDSLAHELNDVSEMVGTVSQTYNITGVQKPRDAGLYHATCSGSGFNDREDHCDCVALTIVKVCGKVQNGSSVSETGGPPSNL